MAKELITTETLYDYGYLSLPYQDSYDIGDDIEDGLLFHENSEVSRVFTDSSDNVHQLGATMLASKFAANTRKMSDNQKGIVVVYSSSFSLKMPKLFKPDEPNFSIVHIVHEDAEAPSRTLPSSIALKANPVDQCSKEQELQKLSVKLILHATGNIAAKFYYNQVLVDAFRRIPHATWNAKERLWIFPLSSLSSAEKVLAEIFSPKVEVENLHPLVQRAIASASSLPDLRGKIGSYTLAIAVASCLRDSWPVLILTPSSLRLHWASMIHQWLNIPSSDIVVIFSQISGSNRGGFTILSSKNKGGIRLDGMFNIISYDLVAKIENVLMASEFKVVIADESHFMKNAQAKRTTACVPIIKKAQYAILLSGTPALSRPIELFKQLEALYPDVYRKVYEYGERYCKGGIFGTYQGASNHEELHNLMKATVMIRRLKKDVLSELPMKRRQQVFLDLTEKDMKKINALFRELEVIKSKIKACQSEEEVQSLKLIEKNLINKIYTDSAEAKIPAVLDYLETVIEKKKVGCIRIDGTTAASSRQALVNDFQEKDSIKAAVLSIKAGGVGLTLTAASTVIFAELSWTPGDLIQAEDRAHRIGQVSSVNIYYLLANDTVDDIIWDVVQHKLETLGQMLDGHENTLEVSASQQHKSPMKQKISDSISSQEQRSPAKQKTIYSFLKRCNNIDDAEYQSKLKFPRH
ncbi:SNF2-related protein [Corchorus capsularis]|uniref:SNF2-related protein n=1 Tax=Corchorus capsularis TaxID=210143 RepID=A0A1R3G3V0_COCAP|nr:SNF2-related protein [Corchorus capsularis]